MTFRIAVSKEKDEMLPFLVGDEQLQEDRIGEEGDHDGEDTDGASDGGPLSKGLSAEFDEAAKDGAAICKGGEEDDGGLTRGVQQLSLGRQNDATTQLKDTRKPSVGSRGEAASGKRDDISIPLSRSAPSKEDSSSINKQYQLAPLNEGKVSVIDTYQIIDYDLAVEVEEGKDYYIHEDLPNGAQKDMMFKVFKNFHLNFNPDKLVWNRRQDLRALVTSLEDMFDGKNSTK
jgi:hypothetical protein